MARRRRSLFVLPVIVFTCSILAGFYGPKVEVASAAAPSEEFDDDVRSFSKVLSLVEANFADKVSADKTVYKGAIPGMLRTLDPHSNFFDAREYQLMREEQKGHYYGVGMQVSPQPNAKTAVKAPFPGSLRTRLPPSRLPIARAPRRFWSACHVCDLAKSASR